MACGGRSGGGSLRVPRGPRGGSKCDHSIAPANPRGPSSRWARQDRLVPRAAMGPMGARQPRPVAALQSTLHRALANANQREHEYATLEHLLLALIDDVDASAVMKACKVDLGALKEHLVSYSDNELKTLVIDDGESKPTAGFQRVIQRAVIAVQSSGRDEATGANVLVAMFAERESPAAYFLQQQGMTRYDAINHQ